jgi:hypothetical protein
MTKDVIACILGLLLGFTFSALSYVVGYLVGYHRRRLVTMLSAGISGIFENPRVLDIVALSFLLIVFTPLSLMYFYFAIDYHIRITFIGINFGILPVYLFIAGSMIGVIMTLIIKYWARWHKIT